MDKPLRVKFTVSITPDRYSWSPSGESNIELDIPESILRQNQVDFSLFLAGMVPNALELFLAERLEKENVD